jgi:XRE family transcriptional regulator, regulator of sulfur utilization
MATPSQAFGAALRELRTERGLSQEDAALASGIDRAYFGKLERATKVPTLTTVWKIADAFNVQPSELLNRAEKLLR